jgi:hypothetical protein
MASQVEIVNLALVQLGDEIILSMTEDTKAARIMSAIWIPTLKEVLEDHTWGFARTRATLAEVATAPSFGYTHAFQLPADFIRMVYMGEPDDEFIWQIEGDQLLTDEDTAEITYIRYVTDTTKFTSKFVTALSCMLIVRAANSIAGMDTTKNKEALELYKITLLDAETVDSQNSTPRVFNANRWRDARR